MAKRHHQHSSVKVICDEVRAAPGDVTIVATGPLTNIALALQQQPDLATLIGHLIMIGGTIGGPGNVTAAAEFNIYCDADAARTVFHSQVTKTLIPIDLTSRVMLSFDLLEKLPDGDSRTRGVITADPAGRVSERIANNWAWRESTFTMPWRLWQRMEPELFTTEQMYGDVETEGSLTYGATVFDRRRHPESRPNMDVAIDMDTAAVTDRIVSRLTRAA